MEEFRLMKRMAEVGVVVFCMAQIIFSWNVISSLIKARKG